jgi:hypothetical protein
MRRTRGARRTRRSVWFWVFVVVVLVLLLGLIFGGYRKGTRVDSGLSGSAVVTAVVPGHPGPVPATG